MAIPSSTAIVLNSRAIPPAACTASDTMRPTGCKCVWPGTNSVKLLAIATIGLPMSAPDTPAARSKARAPAMFRPWVTVLDLNSGMAPMVVDTARRAKTVLALVLPLPVLTLSDVQSGRPRENWAGSCGYAGESVDRSEHGLPPIRGRRNGLRREEVAFLSSISVTWYTWLEQGRDINPSRQVLDAIGETLRLSPADQTYLLSLAGFSPSGAQSPPDSGEPPEHLHRLLEAFGRSPAFAIEPGLGDHRVEPRIRGAVSEGGARCLTRTGICCHWCSPIRRSGC